METTEVASRKLDWKKHTLSTLLALGILSLAGLTTYQVFFQTAIAETSYNSRYDPWRGDPRSRCTAAQNPKGEIAYQCVPNPNVSPTGTVRFYAGECHGVDTGIPDDIILDLPVDMLNKVDPQLGGTGWGGRGSIQVTYRPKIFGFLGSDKILNAELRDPKVKCGSQESAR